MTQNNKILDFISRSRKSLNSSWKEQLELFNIWDDVKYVYEFSENPFDGNAILSYIVLAYDKDSPMLELKKDRKENKEKIMKHVVGETNILSKSHFLQAIIGGSEEIERVINWYLDYQKDWRWSTILSCFEYHSSSLKSKASSNSISSADNLNVGKYKEEGIKQRERGQKMLEDIQREFVTLDGKLIEEGRPAITDVKNFMSFESFIANRNLQKVRKNTV